MTIFHPDPSAPLPRDTSNDVTDDDIAATKLGVNALSVVGMVVSLMCGAAISKVLVGGAIAIIGTHLVCNQAKRQLTALNKHAFT